MTAPSRRLRLPVIATGVYAVAWLVAIGIERMSQFAQYPIGAWTIGVALGLAVPVAGGWIAWTHASPQLPRWTRPLAWTAGGLLWYPLALYLASLLQWYDVRAYVAWLGTLGMFLVGLGWLTWGLERGAQHYERLRLDERAADDERLGTRTSIESRGAPDPVEPIWNPFDLAAWYHNLSIWEWFNPLRWPLIRRIHAHVELREERRPQRRLNQTLSGFAAYSLAFFLAFLILTNLRGCGELYEMPAGGGEQKQLAQQVKVQKIIKKKYVVNPFSSISFKVPPIDDVKLQLTEITKHAYTVGYGAGDGAGFAGGTKRGKVRFIRLEYAGGDWDQDFGVGADLNMLIQYGVRTQHKVADKTESRTIPELQGFPIGASPPMVYLTGQKNISLSKNEVRILREYLIDKHGMLFGDNGGSRNFHNQFLSMMNQVLPEIRPVSIPLDDQIHRIPYQIPFLPYVAPHGGHDALGWKHEGRWIAYYHPGDIADAWADDHSGVRPEVWEACYQLGTNVIFYAHAEYSKWLAARQQQQR